MAFRLPTFKVRLWRKLSIATVVVVFLLSFLLLGQGFVSDETTRPPSYLQQHPKSPRCGSDNLTAAAEAWRRTEDKYKDLIEDKFTIALSTFHRPKELAHTLSTLLSLYIPSLYEVVVVWNNLDQDPPEDFVSSHGVPVRYRVPPRDSLNEKLWPDPTYRTKAILLSDDDVYYRPADLDYVFQMWRQFGQDRLVGALARCASLDRRGEWKYHFCNRRENAGAYSIVLTNLAFAHVGLLDYYFSDAPEAVRVRDHVDSQFNCEDIGLNALASMLTGRGPLLVRGSEQWVNLSPPSGISRNPHHMETRSACLNRFAEAIGCMPLVDEMGRMERGYKHNVWYKSFWDRLGT